MAQTNFYHQFTQSSESALPAAKTAGTMYFTNDQNLYFDTVDGSAQRIKITDLIFLNAVSDLPTSPLLNKFYYVKSDHSIRKYESDGWYILNASPDLSGYLQKSGGTMTGALTLSGAPSSDLQAANKKYVDDSIPSSLPANGGNADTAKKLQTARTISLTGDVSGSTTFDGSENVSVPVTVYDNSHYHNSTSINRSPSSNTAGAVSVLDQPLIDTARACRTAFTPASAVTLEYSDDNGTTWNDYGATDIQKMGLFSMNRAWSASIRDPSATTVTTDTQIRITISPTERYASVDQFYCWYSSNYQTCCLDIERSTIGEKTTFSYIRQDVPLSGWAGNDIVNFTSGTYGGGVNQTSNAYAYRFTFKVITVNNSKNTSFPTVTDLRMYGVNAWSTPNSMMLRDSIYSWDIAQNVTFPANVAASSFSGSAHLTGTPTAPTASIGTNTTQIATTAFVKANLKLSYYSIGKLTSQLSVTY